MNIRFVFLIAVFGWSTVCRAEPKTLLLLGQGPDGHKPTTHEYMAGVRLVSALLSNRPDVRVDVAKADEPWREGPALIDSADGVFVFLSQGAHWIHQDPKRLAALKRLAQRGGGFVGLHWGIGTRKAEDIEEYVKMFGGCHGGPDRKYKVLVANAAVVGEHPVTKGIDGFNVREEFYYKLKFVKPAGTVTPLIRAEIDGAPHTVAWAWERPDGGRSMGFSGGHFHRNWELPQYRRLMAQGVLWTLKLDIPAEGIDVAIDPSALKLSSKPAVQ